jgi:hypothetical protein
MEADDPRRAAIRYAIRQVASGRLSEAEVAKLVDAIDGPAREMAAAERQARQEKMLAELARLEAEGRKSPVALVARKYASDPNDPRAVDHLARKLRRWRQKVGHLSARRA